VTGLSYRTAAGRLVTLSPGVVAAAESMTGPLPWRLGRLLERILLAGTATVTVPGRGAFIVRRAGQTTSITTDREAP
jgi:hypothetical protein